MRTYIRTYRHTFIHTYIHTYMHTYTHNFFPQESPRTGSSHRLHNVVRCPSPLNQMLPHSIDTYIHTDRQTTPQKVKSPKVDLRADKRQTDRQANTLTDCLTG